MEIEVLGACEFDSPLRRVAYVEPGERVFVEDNVRKVQQMLAQGEEPTTFELAGPRQKVFFKTSGVTAAIVTCGGLCPGINDVIRAICMELYNGYGVKKVLGLRYGYAGLNPAFGHEPIELDWDEVDDIHQDGGSILSSSRGDQPVEVMVDFLVDRGIDMLFTIGGDGTQRGALAIHEEVKRRGLPIAIVGVPKSIDNDIACIDRTFGFETAVSEASTAIIAAHNEAKGAPNGVGVVKLMGRHSGFIAAWATLAFSEVNLTLVPEVSFKLDDVLHYVEDRLRRRRHAVIVVAEGAGQELFAEMSDKDKSGNAKLHDIGEFLCAAIKDGMAARKLEASIKYIDPSYMIRGIAANAGDSVYCLRLGQNAVHAAMAGCTGMLVGSWHGRVTHVPLDEATAERKLIDPRGWVWQSVLQATGQPDWESD